MSQKTSAQRSVRETISGLLEIVRSGKEPHRAAEFLAPEVVAHQVRSGAQGQVLRAPENYAAHVADMVSMFGEFSFVVDELIVDGSRAYARWTQSGSHVGVIDGHAPTGAPLETVDSAVYRVADGLIVEYWIQPEIAGLMAQLERQDD